MNFDALGLRERMADSACVDWIYAQHPEWKPPSKHLHSSVDRKNTRSWKGDTSLAHVDEVKCWSDGRQRALQLIRASRCFTEEELDIDLIIRSEPGVDMFRPYENRRVDVMAGDRAVYDLVDLNDASDDMDEEAQEE